MSLRCLGWWLFKRFNRLVARLRGSDGWCYMAYQFYRQGMPEEEDEDGVWAAIPPQGRLASWRGAFTFKYKPFVEAEKK